ncbi:hypothetical protein F2Q69_00048267 [Brassica cretica]|uniref:F-box domain-containing protein n=1 Tax=Brassica cretica TaxID=69181 RepID=A0A8S9PUX9_BRACR|nr:hypothetical protein F2Q69_00048267 [Brassica cretica]
MANFNLASLPPSILHKILSKVATTSIRDFGCARVSFPGFNAVGREDYFYKSADLIFLNDWLDQVNVVRTFRLKCYQLGNPEAIYLRDGMMNLAFSVDHRGLVHNYPDFTREYFDQMYHMITSWVLSGHWGYGKPEMFMSLLERIDPNVCYDCCKKHPRKGACLVGLELLLIEEQGNVVKANQEQDDDVGESKNVVSLCVSVDLWSVGCVFAEILTGRPLLKRKNRGSRRDRNYSPYAIGDISSDYLKRVSIHRFISNHNSGKRVLIGWTKKRKYNNSASTLTYNQPAGSVSISFAKPTFGLTINEDIPSFLKPQVSPDSSEKIRWAH